MGVSEKRLWKLIRDEKLGYKFRRQHPIGPYALDFYCPMLKLCVEVDGEQHALHQDHDQIRDAFLLEKGILTIRIPSMQLFGEDDVTAIQWAFKLENICKVRAIELGLDPHPKPFPLSHAKRLWSKSYSIRLAKGKEPRNLSPRLNLESKSPSPLRQTGIDLEQD